MHLTELLVALSIAAIAGTLAAPSARRALDSVEVRAAREAAYGLSVRARAIASTRGGADLVFDFARNAVTVVDADRAQVATLALRDFGVSMSTESRAPSVVLRYDGRGIGRMTSRTVRFRRGDAEAGLTFSSYGRIRRW